ncbi:hypothetical protein BM50_2086 [Streptococcus pneumoniae]|nr:hypothetical protein BM50_2086 [Streptococcus pneumoniae]
MQLQCHFCRILKGSTRNFSISISYLRHPLLFCIRRSDCRYIWFGYLRMRNINSRTIREVNHSYFRLIIRSSYAISHTSWKLGILAIDSLYFILKTCFGCCEVTISDICITVGYLLSSSWILNSVTIVICITLNDDISFKDIRLHPCSINSRQEQSIITWIDSSSDICSNSLVRSTCI